MVWISGLWFGCRVYLGHTDCKLKLRVIKRVEGDKEGLTGGFGLLQLRLHGLDTLIELL